LRSISKTLRLLIWNFQDISLIFSLMRKFKIGTRYIGVGIIALIHISKQK
jgi:hypothetical protein